MMARAFAVLAFLLWLAPAWAQKPSAPPRSIQDITALLDQHRPDPARVEALKAALKREPPAGAGRDALVTFYRERAAAAQGLGLVKRQLADLRLAEKAAKGSELEWDVMVEIFMGEIQSGNFATALEIKKRTPALAGERLGRLLADYQHAIFLYTSIGDLDSARTGSRNQQAVMYQLGGSPSWAQAGDIWEMNFATGQSLLLDAEGKHAEAEAAQRKAVASAMRYFEAIRSPVERNYRTVDIMRLRLARNLVLQGKLAEAELEVRTVVQGLLARVGRYAPGVATALTDLVRVLIEQGRYRDAESMALAAIDIHKHVGSAPQAVTYVSVRNFLGGALVMQGRWQEALAVYAALDADLGGETASLIGADQRAVNRALAMVKTGQALPAVALVEQGAKRLVDRLGESSYAAAEARGVLAIALAESGQHARALGEFAAAAQVLLASGRGSQESEGSRAKAWLRALIIEGYIKLLYQIRNDGLQQAGIDPAAEAFRLADAARGQSTQRALAEAAARSSAATPALAAVVRKEQDARQQLGVIYPLLQKMLSAPPDQQLPQVIAQMRARIQELEQERRGTFSELEQRFPAYANLIEPRPATVEQARSTLRDGEVLLSILATEESTYVWAVPHTGPVRFHAAPLGERALNRQVAHIRRALDPGEVPLARFPEFDVTAAHRLYAELLKPVEDAWKGARTLMVVANGALSQLPFALLPTEAATLRAAPGVRFEAYRDVPWLVKHLAVTQLPAVSTLVTLRALPAGNASRSPFAGFGDPRFGGSGATEPGQAVAMRMRRAALPIESRGPAEWASYGQLSPLPDTRDEILAIARALGADARKDVYLGTQASKDNVRKADLQSRRIVAFATHGLVPGDLPNLEQPALALSAPNGSAEEGLLTLEDILALKLDADWVVLSACNTAAGDGAGADAVSGLGRGFFYAGSRALLVTHWPVETRSARLLVTSTFERYAAPSVGRAEALRQASLALMQQSAQDGQGKPIFAYAHPIFWAPYALVGDGGR